MRHFILSALLCCCLPAPLLAADEAVDQARASAQIAGTTLSKVQRWLHETALPKIDPESGLYISHTRGSGRYREALWNYDDAAADTYPFLFWAAWYTDHDKIKGPVFDVLLAEQKHCNLNNHPKLPLDRIPTAVNHKTLEKVIKSKDDTVFAAMEYVKDGLIPIVEIAGTDNPWFDRMRAIVDDIWKHAEIDTPYGKITTNSLEANGEMLQVLPRLYCATGERKYLDWAIRLADSYLLPGGFVPVSLRDHGCEIVGGLGLLYGVLSEIDPGKAKVYEPHIKHILDEILTHGINEHGIMFNRMNQPKSGLSDSWGYNYVTHLCYDIAQGQPVYRERVRQTLANLADEKYRAYPWEGKSMDGFADSIEGALYLVNREPVPEALAWIDRETANHIVIVDDPKHMWSTYKLESNGVRTALQHAMMHTRGTLARPWQPGLQLGAHQEGKTLTVVLKSDKAWEGNLLFDKPRHHLEMGFSVDWPRMNSMPEWFTVMPDAKCTVTLGDKSTTHQGSALHQGLPLKLEAGEEKVLVIEKP